MSPYSTFNRDTGLYAFETPPNPAVGVRKPLSVPASRLSMISCLSFILTTDANVADRVIFIQGEFPGTVWPIATSGFVQTASLAFEYIAFPGAGHTLAAPTRFVQFSLPDRILIKAGGNYYIDCEDIQAGDQISAIRIVWRSWVNTTS